MNSTARMVGLFAGLGFLAAGLTWLVTEVLFGDPDDAGALVRRSGEYLPGLSFGALLAVASVAGGIPGRRQPAAGIVIVAASVISWRAALNAAVAMGGSFTYPIAGALGAFIVSIGLLWAWDVRRRRVSFAVIIAAAGFVGGLIHRQIEPWVGGEGDRAVYVLMLQWQALVFAAAAYAFLRTVHPGPDARLR